MYVVVNHPVNRGYGAAVTSGFNAATGDYIMFMDSDRQFDINDIHKLTPFVEDYDIVAGYRIKRNDPAYSPCQCHDLRNSSQGDVRHQNP